MMHTTRWITVAVFSVFCLLCTVSAAAQSAVIIVQIDCADKNHVGHEWTVSLSVNGETYVYQNDDDDRNEVHAALAPITVDLPDRFVIGLSISEEDITPKGVDNSDVSMIEPYELSLSGLPLTDMGYMLTTALTVTEDKGKYKDCSAEWTVTCYFKLN